MVEVPYRNGARRSVVTLLIDSMFVGTSEIIDEHLPSCRLALSGTSEIASLAPTGECWSREDTINGLLASLTTNTTTEDDRQRYYKTISDQFPSE